MNACLGGRGGNGVVLRPVDGVVLRPVDKAWWKSRVSRAGGAQRLSIAAACGERPHGGALPSIHPGRKLAWICLT